LVGSRRHQRHRRSAGDDGEQIAPTAAHAAGIGADDLAQWNAHRLFDSTRPLDVAGNAIKLRAGIVRPADAGEPGGAAAHDVGHLRDGLDVVDGGRAAVEPHIGRERRLQPRHSLLAFEAFEQRRLLAADVGAGAVVNDDVEVVAVEVVLADEVSLIGLRHGRLQPLALADEFAADVDVTGVNAHGEGGHEAALQPAIRIVPHDLAILARAGLRLVGVDDEVVRPPLHRLLGHERPFESGREPGAAAAALTRGLHLGDNSVAAFLQDRFAAVPGAPRACAGKAPIVPAVEILENAILVGEHQWRPGSVASAIGGLGAAASWTFAASPGFFA